MKDIYMVLLMLVMMSYAFWRGFMHYRRKKYGWVIPFGFMICVCGYEAILRLVSVMSDA